jgi:hypothetical protein
MKSGWADLSGHENHWDSTTTRNVDNYLIFNNQTISRSSSLDWQLTNECTIELWYYPSSNFLT